MVKTGDTQIFIVDDDREDRELIIEALRNRGVGDSFPQFENGLKLSNYLSSQPMAQPDLILLDLNMPVQDGYETLKELKADDTWKHIPVVVLTASTKTADQKACFELGCDHFINKPLDMQGYRKVADFLRESFFQKEDDPH